MGKKIFSILFLCCFIMIGSAADINAPNLSLSGKTSQYSFTSDNNTSVPLNNDNITINSLTSIPPLSSGFIQNTTSSSSMPYVPDRIIVRYRNDSMSSQSDMVSIEASMNAQVGAEVLSNESELGVPGLQVLQLPLNTSVSSAIAVYNSSPYVLYAEPDYIVSAYNDGQSQFKSPFPIDPDITTYRNKMSSLFYSHASNSTTGNVEPISPIFSDNHTLVQTCLLYTSEAETVCTRD